MWNNWGTKGIKWKEKYYTKMTNIFQKSKTIKSNSEHKRMKMNMYWISFNLKKKLFSKVVEVSEWMEINNKNTLNMESSFHISLYYKKVFYVKSVKFKI